MNGRPGGDRIGIATALLWLLAALLVNEWTMARGLSLAHLGPRARGFLRALDVALVAWAVAGLRFRRADAVKNLNVLLLSLVALLAGLTVLVQRVPGVLGYEFASGVWSRYNTRPDGIYYEDPVLRMNFMLPNYRTEMYYNGHTWTHQTDALGFRNPHTMTEADVILLGDSFIYGHGIEIEQTVGRALERLTPYSVVNLARQGDCALQEAYLLTRHIGRFRPRHVVMPPAVCCVRRRARGPDGRSCIGHELEAPRPADVFGDRAVEEVSDVDLAALERGGARRLVGDALDHEALDGRRLAPVALKASTVS